MPHQNTPTKPPASTVSFRSDRRGIQFTIEAVLGLLIVASALSASAAMVSNPSGGISDAITQRQLGTDGNDFLEVSAETGALSADGSSHGALLWWDATNQTWTNATRDGPSGTHYTSLDAYPDHPLTPIYQDALTGRGLGMNLYVEYQNQTGDLRKEQIVYQGTPGQNAVRSSYSVVLRDDMTPLKTVQNNNGNDCTLKEMGANTSAGTNGCTSMAYFAPDAAPQSTNYNVVKVSLVLWKL